MQERRGLPGMPEAVVLDEGDFDAEEGAEIFRSDEVVFGAVGDDAAVAHEDDAVDFRNDVGEVVGDHEDAGAFAGDAAEGVTQLALGGEVEGVGGLVEEKHFRAVDEGAGDHDAALLSGGHFSDELFREVGGVHEEQGFAGAGAHLRGDVEIGPERGGGEESGGDGVEAGGDGSALAGKLGGDDAEVGAELGDVPAAAAEEEQLGRVRDDGVALAGDGFDEGGLAASVGAEDGDVLAGSDAEGDGMEDNVVAAGDGDVAHEEEIEMRGLGHNEEGAAAEIDRVRTGLLLRSRASAGFMSPASMAGLTRDVIAAGYSGDPFQYRK